MEKKQSEPEKKKYENRRRTSGEFCQVHLQLPIKFNSILDEISKRNNMTKAAWVTHVLEQVVANDGKVISAKDEDSFTRIEDKLDTVIRMISKL